jgi:hypothetical protein
LLAGLLLAACTPMPTLQERLDGLLGQDEATLIMALGVPVRASEADGQRFLQFEQRRTAPLAPPPMPVFGPWGPGWAAWPGAPSYMVVGCDITAALRDGRAARFSYRGDGCG